MKKFIPLGFCALVCCAVAFMLPNIATTYTDVTTSDTGGCIADGCHSATDLHAGSGHGDCTACHDGTPAAGNVAASTCAVAECHVGTCEIVVAHDPARETSCLVCHPTCAAADDDDDTGDDDDDSADKCIEIDPASVEVDGVDDVTTDVTVSLVRTDVVEADLTEEDLQKLEVSIDTSCADYITINEELVVDAENLQVTANITVAGDAPDATCSIETSDPEGIVDPPLDCSAEFSISSVADSATEAECMIDGIPQKVRVGLGILPRARTFLLTLSEELPDLTIDDIVIEPSEGITISNFNMLAPDAVEFDVTFEEAQTGTYTISVTDCGSTTFEVVRFL